jgi:hypothetical protein
LTPKEREYLRYRKRVLPEQLELARRRVQSLEREAERLGMIELLNNQEGATQ